MIRWLVAAVCFCIAASPVLAADPIEIGIGYLARAGVKPKLSLVELPAENDGLAGARLAIEDNNTTGKFLNQHFTLEEVRLKDNEDVAKAAATLAERTGFIIADLPADDLLKAAELDVVTLDQIDVFDAEPRETFVHAARHAVRGEIEVVRAISSDLCREDVAVAADAGEAFAEETLRLRQSVVWRHVDEIDPAVDRGMHTADAVGLAHVAERAAQRRGAVA